MQNRKSAKKCRLKKKAEFTDLKGEVDGIANENLELKRKVSIISPQSRFGQISQSFYPVANALSDKRNHGHALSED